MRKHVLVCLICNGLWLFSFGQDEAIYLNNPSFEGTPQASAQPPGWIDCGFPEESAPDTHPGGQFAVTKPPSNGNTYLGMVVRDNETWESVSQRLSKPMVAGKCYEFSLDLARSEYYVSGSPKFKDENVNFKSAVKIRIYGGFSYCDKSFLLDETPLVITHRWLRYNFKFEPIANYTYIIIEAFYETPTLFPYNGNVLVDNASPIQPIPCKEVVSSEPKEPEKEKEPATTAVTPKTTPTTKPNNPTTTKKSPEPTPKAEEKTATIEGVSRAEMTVGKTITLKNLYFLADSSRIEKESYTTLNKLYDFLKENPDVSIEVGGHTNSLPPDDYCDRLSEARAKAVADYLTAKGISNKQIAFKGYGKRKPLADNNTISGRRQNQRVEITILGMGK
ncbi:MAG TPA: OmpA family protein [Saprospiraceae bacterium]|nr:OmpA family protein [Saprospiraceae bacterium]HMQ84362.1 OmpA family protein [Saprospiraceae bacterium]